MLLLFVNSAKDIFLTWLKAPNYKGVAWARTADEESRIMPISGGGFEQCYNAQASVDTEAMLVLATHVSQASNDKKEIVPALQKTVELPGACRT